MQPIKPKKFIDLSYEQTMLFGPPDEDGIRQGEILEADVWNSLPSA